HAAILACHILSEQNIINSIVYNRNDTISSSILDHVFNPINDILKSIENSIANHSNEIKDIPFIDSIGLKTSFQETLSKLSEIINKIPQEIEISNYFYDESNLNNLPENGSPLIVEPYKIARYYLDTRFYEPFYRELEQLEALIVQTIIDCREANSLIKFRMDNAHVDIENNLFTKEEIFEFLNSTNHQIKQHKLNLEEAISRIKFKSEEMIKDALSPLYSHAIIQAQQTISALLREHQGRKFSIGLSAKIASLIKKINALIVQTLYSSNKGVILAKKYLNKTDNDRTSIQQILDISEKISPNLNVLSQMPVFYRTLFTSKSVINDDFWVPMEEDLTAIKKAIKWHKNGHGGGILIIGEHGSGKTTLIKYATDHFFKKNHVITINAPMGGSVMHEDWLRELRIASRKNGTQNEIFDSLPSDSIVVINDLELWWERSNSGYAIVEELMQLIKVYGKKVLFIINSNIHSYKQINRVFSMEDNFLHVLKCSTFNSKQLRKLILNRHKSSGINFQYKKKSEKHLTKLHLAVLFNSYYNFSQGIPGVAMNAWIANIIRIENKSIVIKKPEIPNLEVLKALDPDWIIVIALFIQHKNMDVDKLARVTNMSKEESETIISNLHNAGMLVNRGNNIYILDRFMEPFLVELCLKKGII
ncbi:MAG: hypothetical protein PHI36_04550, partial [Bacteroidales bacterium]|nr:hypothetical protein [Bacteroidales bacterium]